MWLHACMWEKGVWWRHMSQCTLPPIKDWAYSKVAPQPLQQEAGLLSQWPPPHSLLYSLQLLYLWALGWRKSVAFCSKQRKAKPKIQRLPDPVLLVKLDVNVCFGAQIKVSEHLGLVLLSAGFYLARVVSGSGAFLLFSKMHPSPFNDVKNVFESCLVVVFSCHLRSILGGLE